MSPQDVVRCGTVACVADHLHGLHGFHESGGTRAVRGEDFRAWLEPVLALQGLLGSDRFSGGPKLVVQRFSGLRQTRRLARRARGFESVERRTDEYCYEYDGDNAAPYREARQTNLAGVVGAEIRRVSEPEIGRVTRVLMT